MRGFKITAIVAGAAMLLFAYSCDLSARIEGDLQLNDTGISSGYGVGSEGSENFEQNKTTESGFVLDYEAYKNLMVREYDGKYLVEGDIVFSSEKAVKDYYYSYIGEQKIERSTGHLVNGKRDVWGADQRKNLTYSISSSFSSSQASIVATRMNTAAGDWENVADVNFIDVTNTGTNEVVFKVRVATPDEENASTIARAFFPNEFARELVLFSKYFDFTTADQERIMRHELGHILGLRHEQYWFSEFSEDAVKLLTEPDTNSIMFSTFAMSSEYNYTGNGQISDLDAQGVRLLYGPRDGYEANPDWYWGSYITDLHIIVGSNSEIAAPIGYIKINVNLNEGAGGKYIYLCYTKWTSHSAGQNQKYLRNLTAGSYSTQMLTAPEGWIHIIDTGSSSRRPNLNEGAGGKWVYLYQNYVKGSTVRCIKAVNVVRGNPNPIDRKSVV